MTVWSTRASALAETGGAGAGWPDQRSDSTGEPGQAALGDSLGPRLGPAATFATTEHFNLQTARMGTIAEANGRSTLYLGTLSGGVASVWFAAC